jgi:hypothetical protein
MGSWARVEVVSLVFWVRRVDGFIEEASLNEGYGKRIMGDKSRVVLGFSALSVPMRCVLLTTMLLHRGSVARYRNVVGESSEAASCYCVILQI